jgi:ribonuclease HI
LLWRICRGCLPTRLRLQEKHVPCPLSCPLCNQAFEDDWHVIFSCNVTAQARQAAGLEQSLLHHFQQAGSVRDAIFAICSAESRETAGMFALLTWLLWQNRNSKVWNNEQVTGSSLGIQVHHLWADWNSCQQIQFGVNQVQQQHVFTWRKPPEFWHKCNVDAAFHKDLNKTSTSWCLRDHMGRFVKAETTWFDGNYSVIEGEAIALAEALRAMEQQHISQVIFESDSKSVVDATRYLRGGFSEFSLIVSQINNLLCCNPNFKVEFVKRQANMVAHTLARAAISWSRRCIFETLPTCISTLLINEMV